MTNNVSINNYCLLLGLSHFANDDHVGASRAIKKMKMECNSFFSSRQGRFLSNIFECMKSCDSDMLIEYFTQYKNISCTNTTKLLCNKIIIDLEKMDTDDLC